MAGKHPFDSGDGAALTVLAEGCNEAVVILGDSGLTYLNSLACLLLGKDLKTLAGKKPADLVEPPPGDLPPDGPLVWQARLRGKASAGRLVTVAAHRLADGGQLWFLRPVNTLAELGALAAGLVHNLAGPLSVVRSSAELLDIYLSQTVLLKPQLKEVVDAWPQSVRFACHNIIEQVDQITVATRDLLAKLRGESARHHGPQDLNAILRREVHFLQNDLAVKHNVDCQLNLDHRLPEFRGLYSDFSQSFRNVLRNAVEAMKQSERRVLQVGTTQEDDWIVVTFTDTGKGIPEEVKAKMFEPFFTTGNSDSQSSGLGLHSVRQLLSPYDAVFEVASRPGMTTFTIRLPRERASHEK